MHVLEILSILRIILQPNSVVPDSKYHIYFDGKIVDVRCLPTLRPWISARSNLPVHC
jgi:hypothetical protein